MDPKSKTTKKSSSVGDKPKALQTDEEKVPTTGPDLINHPTHYSSTDVEPIDVIESWGLDFHLGNVVKYIARWNRKGNRIQNLEKAEWYLRRRIDLLLDELTPHSSKEESVSSSKE